MDVTDLELNIREVSELSYVSSFLENIVVRLKSDNAASQDERCKVAADGTRTTAYVKNARSLLYATGIEEVGR